MKQKPQELLRSYVASCRDDDPDEPDYIPTDEAVWTEEPLQVESMIQCFGVESAKQWIAKEIASRVSDGLDATQYIHMLARGVIYSVVVTMTPEGKLNVCDGWHRIAIAIIRNEPIRAVVGRRPTSTKVN